MTISSATRKAGPFLGNGVTNSFPFTFKVFLATDIQVVKTSSSGTDTTLTLNSDYSVALNADQNNSPGGSVTYPLSGTLLQTGEKLTATGVLADLQGTHITNGGNFFANNIEDQMDYLTILVQQHSEKLARALLGSLSDLAPNFSLGTAVQRANTYLAFDGNGNVLKQPATPAASAFAIGDVRLYGAKFDGVTDDWSAWNTALNSGRTVIFAPEGRSFLSQGIVIPPNVMVVGAGCLASNPQIGGTVLLFANSVATCVTLINGVSNGAATLKGVSVIRNGGAPPAGSIGVYVFAGYPIFLTEVFSYNHAIGIAFKGAAGGLGLGARLDKVFTAAISDCHIQIDTWPELYCFNSRFGQNGLGDLNGTTYVRVKGGVPASANGPNTIHFVGCQFNQGSNMPQYFWQFVNLNGTLPTTDATDFLVDGCHIEGLSTAYFYSDATWNIIDRFTMVGCVLNTVQPLFALNVATALSECQFADNDIFASTVTLAPTGQISAVEFSSNRINSTMSLTGTAGSTLVLADNSHGGNVTVSGTWGYLKLAGSFTAGAFTWNAATAALVWLEGGFSSGLWTPKITFGGASVGQAYTLQAGSFQILGNRLRGDFAMIISALGSSTGTAAISGLPYPIANKSAAQGGGGVCTYATPMASLSGGPLALNAAINTSTLNVFQSTATGIAIINQGNFGAVPVSLFGTFDYQWQ